MEHSPLEQFEIHPILPINIGGLDVSFTNSALWMAIAVGLVYALVMYGARHRSIVPGRLQALVELSYEFIADMVGSTVGKEGRKYFPFVFTLFMFVLFGNTLGMIPGSFAYTSHIIVTFSMAIFVVTAVTVIGFIRHGWHFLSLFAPRGCPIYVMPLLSPIVRSSGAMPMTPSATMKPAKVLIMMWPAVMLIARRSDRLTGRTR